MVRERIKTLEEYAALAACFFVDELPEIAVEELLPKKRRFDEVRDALGLAHARLAALPAWNAAEIEAPLRALADHLGWKVGDLFLPVRVAVTGSKVSPPLFETLEVVGRERTLARLERAHAFHPPSDG
jgi:glutamyl-tRNA synthetase